MHVVNQTPDKTQIRRGSRDAAKREEKRRFVSQMDSVALLRSKRNNTCRAILTVRRKARKRRDLKRKKASRKVT